MKYKSIFLSGLPGSGKSTLAQRLSSKYKWPVHSIGQLFRNEWGRKYPDGSIGFEEYMRSTSDEENIRVNREMSDIVRKGNVICDARYPWNLDDSGTLLVFVQASLDTRAARTSGRNKELPHDVIKKLLSDRETDDVERCKRLFGFDYRNPNMYHFVLNSGLLTVGQELSIVKNAIQ